MIELDTQTKPQTLFFEYFNDLNKILDSQLQNEIKLYIPSANTPSNLGHPCDRRLVYARTRGQDAQKHSIQLEKIFDFGRTIEDYTQKILKKGGIEVLQNQTPFKDYDINLSAKIDCMISHPNLSPKPVLCEIKSMSPNYFNKFSKQEDFLTSNIWYYNSYYTQIQSYLYLVSQYGKQYEEWAAVLLFNKTSRNFKWVRFMRDDNHIQEHIIKKCQRINFYIDEGILPDAEYNEAVCSECPFNHICNVNKYEESINFINNQELIKALNERDALTESHKKYLEYDEFVKDTMKSQKTEKGNNVFLVGDYEIKIGTVTRKAYSVPETTYDKVTIKKLVNS
jgi:CRISPR/Cas system-associated exonuclease Cas4 (RecB family)